jgi:ankyrin repeat protein
MSFWRRLFGANERAKGHHAIFAEKRQRRSVVAEEASGSRASVAPESYTPEQSASFREAAYVGNLEQVQAMLNDNPDLVSSSDHWRGFSITALHFAASKGHKAVVALLLAGKAKINAQNAYGLTPLHLAVTEGHQDVAELLVANGADVDIRGYEFRDTALSIAKQRAASSGLQRDKDLVELLRSHSRAGST